MNPIYPQGPDSILGGVYRLINLITLKAYVGSASVFRSRWYDHLEHLKRGDHDNQYLQRAFNKYGEENFKFEIVEIVSELTKENLEKREQYWLDFYQSYDRSKGYNICTKAYTRKGVPSKFKGKHHTEESNEKNRQAHLGKIVSEETRKKLSLSLKGKKRSETYKEKLAKAKQKFWEEVEMGIRQRPRNGRLKYKDTLNNYEWCKARSDENLTSKEIADLIGCSTSSVRRSFEKFNLPYKKLDTTFKKGIIPVTKGKNIEEAYGLDKAVEIRKKESKAQKEYRESLPRNPLCPKGHDKDIVGRTTDGKCRVCVGERTRAYYAAHRDEILAQKKEYDARMKLVNS